MSHQMNAFGRTVVFLIRSPVTVLWAILLILLTPLVLVGVMVFTVGALVFAPFRVLYATMFRDVKERIRHIPDTWNDLWDEFGKLLSKWWERWKRFATVAQA